MSLYVSKISLSDQIAAYRQLPDCEKPANGKVILESLKNAEKYWSDGDQRAFWGEHEAVIAEVSGISREEEKAIDWKSGVTWPAYYYFQVHPETDALSMMTRYSHGMQHSQIGDASAFCQSIFVLPPEYKEFRATLQMLEERLKGKKLVDFDANEWERLFKATNASLRDGGGQKRTVNSIVINTLKFYQCETKKESFKGIDKYFNDLKQPDKFAVWEKIRTRVWDFVYKQGSNVFTHEETSFLAKHDLFHQSLCPPPEELDKLMRVFCRELPKKMKSPKDIFELMAYVHQKLVHMHYFKDENGRTSRIVMGLIASQAGISPVLIEKASEYARAVAKEDPTKLAELLRTYSESQNESLGFVKAMDMLLKMTINSTLSHA